MANRLKNIIKRNDVVKNAFTAGDFTTGSYDPFTNVFTVQSTKLDGAQLDKFTGFNTELSASAIANSNISIKRSSCCSNCSRL